MSVEGCVVVVQALPCLSETELPPAVGLVLKLASESPEWRAKAVKVVRARVRQVSSPCLCSSWTVVHWWAVCNCCQPLCWPVEFSLDVQVRGICVTDILWRTLSSQFLTLCFNLS